MLAELRALAAAHPEDAAVRKELAYGLFLDHAMFEHEEGTIPEEILALGAARSRQLHHAPGHGLRSQEGDEYD
jgi:hypothetical protein